MKTPIAEYWGQISALALSGTHTLAANVHPACICRIGARDHECCQFVAFMI